MWGMGQKESLALGCSNMTGCLLGFIKNCSVYCLLGINYFSLGREEKRAGIQKWHLTFTSRLSFKFLLK